MTLFKKLANPNQAKREKLRDEIADIERRMNKFDDDWEEQIRKLEQWNDLVQLRAKQLRTIKANQTAAEEAGVEPDPDDDLVYKEFKQLYREATDGFNKTHAEADRLVKPATRSSRSATRSGRSCTA